MRTIPPQTLRAWLKDGDELALLDVREAGEFGTGHLLFAAPVPFSRFEVELTHLVPRRITRTVLYDDGASLVAERASLRASALGYEDVYLLAGGTRGWERAGFRLFAGVNVPSKVFGELVENARHTPTIAASTLRQWQLRGERLVVVDGRPLPEYQRMNIPGSVCCPNGELALRISEVVEDDATPIIVNCAGRTRSMIGAQTLVDIGISNPVYALENGTQGWSLAGFDLERGSTRGYPPVPPPQRQADRATVIHDLANADGVREIDGEKARHWLADPTRTTYLLDVRTPEEWARDPLRGVQNAPGGQLVQATDQWLAVRGARVLLVDHDGIRAPLVARWLRRMGWDTHTIRSATGAALAASSVLHDHLAALPLPKLISPDELEASVRDRTCAVLDLRPSMDFRRAHLPHAIWSIRPRVAADVPKESRRIVLVSDDLRIVRMAAQELIGRTDTELYSLDGGFQRWVEESRPFVASPAVPADEEAIDFLFFVHDRHEGNLDAARKYLEWEQGLIALLEPEERAAFKP